MDLASGKLLTVVESLTKFEPRPRYFVYICCGEKMFYDHTDFFPYFSSILLRGTASNTGSQKAPKRNFAWFCMSCRGHVFCAYRSQKTPAAGTLPGLTPTLYWPPPSTNVVSARRGESLHFVKHETQLKWVSTRHLPMSHLVGLMDCRMSPEQNRWKIWKNNVGVVITLFRHSKCVFTTLYKISRSRVES